MARRRAYTDGTRAAPVLVIDESEACDVAVERQVPVFAKLGDGTILFVFPSRVYDVVSGPVPMKRIEPIDIAAHAKQQDKLAQLGARVEDCV